MNAPSILYFEHFGSIGGDKETLVQIDLFLFAMMLTLAGAARSNKSSELSPDLTDEEDDFAFFMESINGRKAGYGFSQVLLDNSSDKIINGLASIGLFAGEWEEGSFALIDPTFVPNQIP